MKKMRIVSREGRRTGKRRKDLKRTVWKEGNRSKGIGG
jgi:hypothetical protein